MLAMVLAILAGRLIAKRVKESTITILGGILFMLFSVYELLFEVFNVV